MNYLKKLIISSKEIIITYIIEYLVIIISCIIYKLSFNKDLNIFINNTLPIISIISLIIITIYLYIYNKRKESNINYKYIPVLISIGISQSCLLNMIIFKIFPSTKINNNISLSILIMSSGLIGPLYEEILFRYINLHKLKKFNSNNFSILLNSIIFSLIHFNLKKIFFAFFLSLTINIIYHKHNNIIYPIIIHTSANIISLFLYEYNHTIFLLSIICILINYEIIKIIN